MRAIVPRTMSGTCTYVDVVISPATHASPVVTSVSAATRASGSSVRIASRIASEIASATLSGCPSVTDSDVNSRRSDIARSIRRCVVADRLGETLAQDGFGFGGGGRVGRGVGGFLGRGHGNSTDDS